MEHTPGQCLGRGPTSDVLPRRAYERQPLQHHHMPHTPKPADDSSVTTPREETRMAIFAHVIEPAS